MSPVVTRAIESLILPPGILLLAMAAGLLLRGRRPLLAIALTWGALLVFYLLSIPAVAVPLINTLESRWPALSEAQLKHPSVQAIVVLAGGRKPDAPEYGGGDTVSYLSLVRLRYAVWLQRHTRLPIIVAGGVVFAEHRKPEARLMAQVLEQEFQIDGVQTEESSRTTRENARRIAVLLKDQGIQQVYLVTHAFHMPRAVASFEAAGLKVIPAPTAFTGGVEWQPAWPLDYLPQTGSLNTSYLALHEYAGMLWYRITGLLDGEATPLVRGNPSM